jgi:hypothetical protein
MPAVSRPAGRRDRGRKETVERFARITLTRLTANTAAEDRALAFSSTHLLDGLRRPIR